MTDQVGASRLHRFTWAEIEQVCTVLYQEGTLDLLLCDRVNAALAALAVVAAARAFVSSQGADVSRVWLVRDWSGCVLSIWSTAAKAQHALKRYREHGMVNEPASVSPVEIDRDAFSARRRGPIQKKGGSTS